MSQAQDELVARASDPHAELSTLHELAQNYPGLRPYIAANPRTYPELLEWLGSLGDPAVNAALERRSSQPAPAVHPPQAVPGGRPGTSIAGAAGAASTPTRSVPSNYRLQPEAYDPSHPGGPSSGPNVQTGGQTVVQPPVGAGVEAPTTIQPGGQAELYDTLPNQPFQPFQGAQAAQSPAFNRPGPQMAQPAAAGWGAPAQGTGWNSGSEGGLFGVGTEAEETDILDRPRSNTWLWILASIATILVVAILVWFLTSDEDEPSAGATPTPTNPAPPVQETPIGPTETPTPTPTPTPSPTPTQELKAPAPEGAIEMSSFTAPSGNIACTLGEESVSCVINEHSFIPTDASCNDSADLPFTVTVGKEGQASGSCGAPFLSTHQNH